MADMYAVSGKTLTGIADAIRSKTGSDDFMTVASMASAIEGISGGKYDFFESEVTVPQNSVGLGGVAAKLLTDLTGKNFFLISDIELLDEPSINNQLIRIHNTISSYYGYRLRSGVASGFEPLSNTYAITLLEGTRYTVSGIIITDD